MAYLVEQILDLAFSPCPLVLEWVRLGAVEVGFASAWHEDAAEARGVADREDVLEGAEADGGERTVRDGVRQVQRGLY